MYICTKCDAQTLKWAGRCSDCGEWGSLAFHARGAVDKLEGEIEFAPPKNLEDIKSEAVRHISSGISEFDRVLGGGFVSGGVYLLAGEPGIGKSTLVAECGSLISAGDKNFVLYVSGEESPEQLKLRFLRVSKKAGRVRVMIDTRAEAIAALMQKEKPALAIVDSIQTAKSERAGDMGEVARLRAAAAILLQAAKASGVPTILVGQVTKALDIAGPKSFEHLVDSVLSFEGDPKSRYRLLRAVKNRFGGTDEVGVFEMTPEGLREVLNPSGLFLEKRADVPGSAATCVLEGSRPIFLEVQALASRSHFPYPERRASGFDVNRLNMLIAVLGREMGMGQRARADFSKTDIHLNIVGGFRIRDTSADLAVMTAIVSSIFDVPVPQKMLVFGEVGLSGEVRSVRDEEKRIAAAKKLGFIQFLSPSKITRVSEAVQRFDLRKGAEVKPLQ